MLRKYEVHGASPPFRLLAHACTYVHPSALRVQALRCHALVFLTKHVPCADIGDGDPTS